MSLPRWIRQAVGSPRPSLHQPAVPAEVNATGLLTATLTCGQCHCLLRADAVQETVQDEAALLSRPLRITDGRQSWLLEWRCPACGIPSHATLPMVSPSGP